MSTGQQTTDLIERMKRLRNEAQAMFAESTAALDDADDADRQCLIRIQDLTYSILGIASEVRSPQ